MLTSESSLFKVASKLKKWFDLKKCVCAKHSLSESAFPNLALPVYIQSFTHKPQGKKQRVYGGKKQTIYHCC